MNSIAQEARYRQRVVKYFYKHGATKASIRFKVCRQSVYNWAARYDGTWKSLVERSHRPHHHPKEHTQEEKEKILRRYPYYKNDMIALWDSLRKSGYTRSYGSMLRVIKKWVKPEIAKRTARKPKPYERAMYPGQKVQVDVKYVPSYCVADGKKYYQYTAVDECSRWTYREMYDEHSTYSSRDFVWKLIKHAPFPVREVQTDNGTEFTNRLLVIKSKHLTMFEKALEELGILYHRIQIATPRHNGKVERQHRTDEARFYKNMRMYSLEDGRKQLAVYQRKSNNYIKTCLGMKSPNTIVRMYQGVMF